MLNNKNRAAYMWVSVNNSVFIIFCSAKVSPCAPSISVQLQKMLAKASEKSQETILLGDFNVNFLKQDNKDLKSILNIFGYKQMIQKPTRIVEASESLIDVILTNKPSNVVKTEVIPTGIGDHDMVGCTRKMNRLRFKPRQIICRDYRKCQP